MNAYLNELAKPVAACFTCCCCVCSETWDFETNVKFLLEITDFRFQPLFSGQFWFDRKHIAHMLIYVFNAANIWKSKVINLLPSTVREKVIH